MASAKVKNNKRRTVADYDSEGNIAANEDCTDSGSSPNFASDGANC